MPNKQINIGTCRLCQNQKVKLTKAHLFSKGLLGFLGHPIDCTIQEKPLNAEEPLTINLTLNEGWFDYILCAECNNVTISKHERTLKDYLSLHRTPYDPQLQDNITKFLQKNQLTQDQLYSHLKLAILSFFWQFQVAEVKPAKEKVELFEFQISEKDLEQIRKMILHGNEGKVDEYPISIVYGIPKKRLETLSQPDLGYIANEIHFDIFALKLLCPNPTKFYSENELNILSPHNIDQPFDHTAFSDGEMRNAILDESNAQFIQNLFDNGKNDERSLPSTPSHPIRILKELIAISPSRSKTHYETIIDVLLFNLNDEKLFCNKYNPLDVFEEFMSESYWSLVEQNDSNTRLQNFSKKGDDSSLKVSEYYNLRKRIINGVIDDLNLENPSKTYGSIKFLMFNCTSYVEPDKEEPLPRNNEALKTLTVVQALVHEKKLSIPSIALVAIKVSNIEYYSPNSVEMNQLLMELNELIHLQISTLDNKMVFWLTKRHNLSFIKRSLKDSAAETVECTQLAEEVVSKYSDVEERNEYFNSITRIIKESIPKYQNEGLDTLTHFCIELENTMN